MRYNKLIAFFALCSLFFTACNKGHYDLSNVNGVHTQGEMLLPIASGNYTMVDLMERFQMDSLIDYDPEGNMSYNLLFEQMGLVEGSELLKFKDLTVNETHSFVNPAPGIVLPAPIDTTFSFTQTIHFESEHIGVRSATMESGRFQLDVTSDVVDVRKITVRTPDIKDKEGNDFYFVYFPGTGLSTFDLSGMSYQTAESNRLNLNFEVQIKVEELPMSDFVFDVSLVGTDFVIEEMSGYVSTYSKRNQLDTIFNVFPDKLSGMIGVENVLVTLSERNTFGIGAEIVVDTAQISGDGIEPFDLISPLPLEFEAVPSPIFTQVFQQYLDSRLNAHAGHAYISSDLILNPEGNQDLVMVNDESAIDLRVHAHVPFEFNVDDIHYIDTVNLRLSELESPEWIKKMTLELTFVSTIPFNLNGNFMMYDSEHDVVTYTLLDDATLIASSYDGQPTTTQVTIEITDEDLIQHNIFASDRIILDFDLGTESHDVVLNASQYLNFTLKSKVQYGGVIELNKN